MDSKTLDVAPAPMIFLWGMLAHPDMRAVLGVEDNAKAHTVRGWSAQVQGPHIRLEPGTTATLEGQLVPADDRLKSKLAFFLAASTGSVTMTELASGIAAPAGLRKPSPGGDAVEIEAAREVMRLYPNSEPHAISRRYEMMLLRASTRLRAAAMPAPRAVRAPKSRADVTSIEARQPYANYFTVEEHDLQFPRFDGARSAPVTRAAFVGGDAVTILPYDPIRDRVLIIEQFRFAPYIRNDPNPWVLEPPAGRIDAGETPSQAATREMAEETGIHARSIEQIAAYYPSPGAWTEYLYSFIGLCDLPDASGHIGGLDGEDEDILSHVISYEDAMGLMASGECDAGPLWLSLMWLGAHRDRLRATA